MPWGIPLMVWLTVALFGSLSLLATVQHPTYRAPDEPRHVDLVRLMLATPVQLPQLRRAACLRGGPERSAPVVGVTVTNYTSFRRVRDFAPPATKRPSFRDLGSEKQTTELNSAGPAPADQRRRRRTDAVRGDRGGAGRRGLAVRPHGPVPPPAERPAGASHPAAVLPHGSSARRRRLHRNGCIALLAFVPPYFTTVISCVTNDSLLVLEGGLLTYLLTRVWNWVT